MEVQVEKPKSKQKKKKQRVISSPPVRSEDVGPEPSSSCSSIQSIATVVSELQDAAKESELHRDNDTAYILVAPTIQTDAAPESTAQITVPFIEISVSAPQELLESFDKISLENHVESAPYLINVDSINEFVQDIYPKLDTMESTPPIEIPEIVCANRQTLVVSEQAQIQPLSDNELLNLYQNSEYVALERFSEEFLESELKGVTIKQHPLYELLSNYLRERREVVRDTLQLDQNKKDCAEAQNNLWTLSSSAVSGYGTCTDGNSVSAAQTFTKAAFHRTTFKSVTRFLSNIRSLANESYTLHSYSAEISKLNIDFYIQTITTNCLTFGEIDTNSSVQLNLCDPPQALVPHLYDLRCCISILFAFQRKLIRDITFLDQSRQWLSQLVAILLRVANWQDHLFILNHLLRCPPRVGTWAANFLQLPFHLNTARTSPFVNYEVNHIIATITVLLLPIQKREDFLSEFCPQMSDPSEALWIMVDSDGEDDDETQGTFLRENDIVAFLNQIPLHLLFQAVLKIKDGAEQLHFNEETKPDDMLRLFAFALFFVKILREGLRTYTHNRYTQLSKRLSRFVRHTLDFVTDHYEQYRSYNKLLESQTQHRLQVEYDHFFLKVIECLYFGERTSAWQFLAVLPFHLVSLRQLWGIGYFLHHSDDNKLKFSTTADDVFLAKMQSPELKFRFQEKIVSLADGESYYLLNTCANMALARDIYDIDFIRTITLNLLHIGFVSEATQDVSEKTVRILLTHLTSKHPHLLSDVLASVAENLTIIGDHALYLYEELPISVWRPTTADLDYISHWITSRSFTDNGVESKLARMIISRLNWNLLDNYYLFLPYSTHCRIALLALQASIRNPTVYDNWAWQTSFRLKMHISDKGFRDFANIKEIAEFDEIVAGIKDQNPLAAFLSVLMTNWGHLIPKICEKGFQQLLFLQQYHKHEAVLFALNLLVPLFLECQETLINDEQYQTILQQLLAADRGYINYAKSFIVSQTTVLDQFGNMIEAQISNFPTYNLSSPKYLARIWTNSLVSFPSWNRDPGVLYLLDVIIRASFFHADAVDAITAILREIVQGASTPTANETNGSISSLFRWVSSGSNQNNLILNMNGCPWLAFLVLKLEFEEREKNTGIWKELLSQLQVQKGKVNIDAAIKKATTKLKTNSFSSSSMCIYRWAQQALDAPFDHPILPLLWQKYFELFLQRIENTSDNKGCIGEKFLEGIVNSAFQKRLKRRLQETVDYFKEQLLTIMNLEENRKHFLNICLKLFTAYNLWLDETRLHDANLYLQSLPPQYEPQLLGLIFQGSSGPWLEYVDYDRVKADQQVAIKTWRCANYRERSTLNRPLLRSSSNTTKSNSPYDRISKRLASYDTPASPPKIRKCITELPSVNVSSDKATINSLLNGYFKTVLQFAHNYNLRVAEQTALDCTYQELIPQLYRSVPIVSTNTVHCSGTSKNTACTGAATIILNAEEARINEHIDHQIKSNRTEYESVVAKFLQTPAHSLCSASVFIHQVISTLQCQIKYQPENSETGVELFYYILSKIPDETSNFLPVKKLLSTCLEKLGESHISGFEMQMPRLLQKILQEPNLGMYLAPHFTPAIVGIATFLIMYETISREMSDKYDINFALLSKFDLTYWLQNRHPKLSQQSQCIGHIINALMKLGQEPPVESLVLHDVYRRHLICLLRHQFPSHYGDILQQILRSSNSGNAGACVAINVWTDIIGALAEPCTLDTGICRDQLRHYAHTQKTLNYRELLDTVQLLCRHFTGERMQYGLYGLYPKTRTYIDVFALYHGMTGHALIISALQMNEGLLGDQICEIVWPQLRDMFAPWLVPYWLQNMKENMAAWMQQLTDDRAALLPWIAGDAPFAQKMAQTFFECVLFTIHTLPACHSILSLIWQWYVTNFTNAAVKDHILNVIHSTLQNLPWQNFWPNINDLECMIKVVAQYLPECHSFLGAIFVDIPWHNWLYSMSDDTPPAVKSRIYNCLLVLIVKLANEPHVRKNCSEKAKNLLVYAENYDWCQIDANNFQQIIDWFVQSYDPVMLYRADPLNLDYRVLQYLRIVAEYDKPSHVPHLTVNQLTKRHAFVRGYTKLIAVFVNKHKSMVPSRETVITTVMADQLAHMEEIVTDPQEMATILGEYMSLLNISAISGCLTSFFEQWLVTKCVNEKIMRVALQSIVSKIGDTGVAAQICESSIQSYFDNTEHCTWTFISNNINLTHASPMEFTKALIANECVLTLYALLLLKGQKHQDYRHAINSAIDWLNSIKPSETIEPKLPLIWNAVIKMCLVFCTEDEANAGIFLYKLAQSLLQSSDEKESSKWGRGLLNAIGVTKSAGYSLQLRFLCRAMAGYILAQLPESRGKQMTVRQSESAPYPVGRPGGNVECSKVLLKLDFGQSQGKIKETAELALKEIQTPSNSLHNAHEFLCLLISQFYNKPYLYDIK